MDQYLNKSSNRTSEGKIQINFFLFFWSKKTFIILLFLILLT